MGSKLTRELLICLENKGYTILVADGELSKNTYLFMPTKWDVEEFLNNFMYGYDDSEILIVSDVLKSTGEILPDHEVII